MVMEMFAETASGEEAHAVALDSVQLPQVCRNMNSTLCNLLMLFSSLFHLRFLIRNNMVVKECDRQNKLTQSSSKSSFQISNDFNFNSGTWESFVYFNEMLLESNFIDGWK